MIPRRLLVLLAIVVIAGLSFPHAGPVSPRSSAADPAAKQDAPDDLYELYKVLADTIDQVERNYVQDISRRELIEAAVDGILKKLDPYSSYIGPDELERFRTSVDSEFGGIGIQVTVEQGQLKIISPLVGTPAYRAGLQAGDRITKIGDESTDGVTLDEAIRRLKGPPGEPVTFTVVSPGESESRDVTVVREIIHVETVLGDTRDDDDQWRFMFDRERRIGYIRVTAFSRDTAKELRQAVQSLADKRLNGLILDLRFNPGGLLSSAIEVADMFVSEGTIVSTEGRNIPKRTWSARGNGSFTDFPMVVLTNRYSASASEIVSACLQDHERAVVIGERTWGKGSVQNVVELEGGRSALKLTTASYHRPSGENIHRFTGAEESDVWGVTPNEGFLIRLSDSETSRLIRHRRDRDVLKRRDDDRAEAGSEMADSQAAGEAADADADAEADAEDDEADSDGSDEFVDVQLQRALDHLTAELAKAD